MFGRSVRATRDERNRPLPGDELIPQAIASLAHAITIRRGRRDVWPWLAQMGAGSRAGWYSYDSIDNARRPSAIRIVPELQQLSVGTIFPALPGITDGFSLLAFEPNRFLVLGWRAPDATLLVTWAFVLEETSDQVTRLIVRARAGRGYRFKGMPWWFGRRIASFVHFVMQRKQLLGIARRVESALPRGTIAHQQKTEVWHESGAVPTSRRAIVGRGFWSRSCRLWRVCRQRVVSLW